MSRFIALTLFNVIAFSYCVYLCLIYRNEAPEISLSLVPILAFMGIDLFEKVKKGWR